MENINLTQEELAEIFNLGNDKDLIAGGYRDYGWEDTPVPPGTTA